MLETSAILVDDLQHLTNVKAFHFGYMRLPDFEYENQSVLVASVPGFMFDGIVEREDLAFLPLHRALAHAEIAIWRNDQRQMADIANIEHAGVRRDMCAGFQ